MPILLSGGTILLPLYQVTVADGKLVGVSHDRVNAVFSMKSMSEMSD